MNNHGFFTAFLLVAILASPQPSAADAKNSIFELVGVSPNGFQIYVSAHYPAAKKSTRLDLELTGFGTRLSTGPVDIAANCIIEIRVSIVCRASSPRTSPYLSGATFKYWHNTGPGSEHQYLCAAGCSDLIPTVYDEHDDDDGPILFNIPPVPPPAPPPSLPPPVPPPRPS